MLTAALAATMVAAMEPSPSAAAAAQDGRLAECANDVLASLKEESDHRGGPYIVGHTALMARFVLCGATPLAYFDSILSAMREDIATIYRHRDDRDDQDELQDVSAGHWSVVCIAWATIYQVEYDYAVNQYGSGSVAHLPTPATRWADCRRWSG